MMSQISKTHGFKLQRGLSIVEILVVIVILLFGVLSIIKVYPTGFLVMHNASNAGLAVRMDSALLDQAQADGSMPDAVYVTSPTASIGTFDPTKVPTDLANMPGGPNQPSGNDIDKARYIYNEKVSIPTVALTSTLTPSAPAAVLHYGPIYLTKAEQETIMSGGTSALTSVDPTHMSVISMPWTEHDIVGASPNPPSDGEFYVDKTTDGDGGSPQAPVYALQFPRRQYEQIFYVYFTLPDGTVHSNILTLPAWDGQLKPSLAPLNPDSTSNYDGDMVQVSLSTAPGTDMSPSSLSYFSIAPPQTWTAIKVSRVFVPATKATFSTNPYEYTLPGFNSVPSPPYLGYCTTALYADKGGATMASANLGVLLFNPLIGSVLTGSNSKALVSYTVYDWHIIHDDQTVVPGAGNTAGTTTIDLSVGGLKTPGEIQSDGNVYESVIPNTYPQGGLYVIDRDSGEPLFNVDTFFYDSSNITGATNGIVVDYKKGKVTLATSVVAAHPHLRFYYQTTNDLGLALEKSPTTFAAAPGITSVTVTSTAAVASATPPILIPASTFWVSNSYNSSNSIDYILFPPSMEGKTVELQNITCYDTAGKPHNLGVQNLSAVVSASTITVSDSSGTASVAYADVTSALEGAAASAGIPRSAGGAFAVGSATSENAQAFCIWHENGVWKTHTTSASSN